MPEFARLLIVLVFTFLFAISIGPFAIKLLHQLKFGQSIRAEGPQTHLKKSGTPTMGGVIILLAIIFGLLVSGQLTATNLWLLFITIGTGLVGFIDDFIIIIKKRSMGLKARQKLLGQVIVAGLAVVFFGMNNMNMSQLIPFTNSQLQFSGNEYLGISLFFVFAVFWIVGFSNAVNLTDGLDGLASGTTAVAALVLGALAFFQGYTDVAFFAVIVAGACLGFIWFNGPPASVFMGDTGSLALGAALAGIALFTHLGLFLPIIGGIFVAETLSVIIQVTSFKMMGKRIFRMSPLHHHFELGGMVEPKIMLRFWIVGLLLGILGILGYVLK